MMPAPKISRGIRNNNPGNLRRTKTPWRGLAEGQADVAFAVFSEPFWGIRALAKTLLTYYREHQLDTVEKIIHRWAPPSENDTGAYARSVAGALKVGIDTRLMVENPTVLANLTKAIIKHENGSQPYEDELIDRAIAGALGVAQAAGA